MRRNPGEAQRPTFRRPLGRHFGGAGAEPPLTISIINKNEHRVRSFNTCRGKTRARAGSQDQLVLGSQSTGARPKKYPNVTPTKR